MSTLKQGNKAPAFKGKDQNGKLISLADFKGKKVVLYFYPQDDTPTCTTQACNLRDNYGLLKNKGYEVIGVSPDEVAKHKKFENKKNHLDQLWRMQSLKLRCDERFTHAFTACDCVFK